MQAEKCKFWPDCKNGDDCPFYHPTVTCRWFIFYFIVTNPQLILGICGTCSVLETAVCCSGLFESNLNWNGNHVILFSGLSPAVDLEIAAGLFTHLVNLMAGMEENDCYTWRVI